MQIPSNPFFMNNTGIHKHSNKYAIPTNIPPPQSSPPSSTPTSQSPNHTTKARTQSRRITANLLDAQPDNQNQNTLAKLLMFQSGEIESKQLISQHKIASLQHWQSTSYAGSQDSNNPIKHVVSRYEAYQTTDEAKTYPTADTITHIPVPYSTNLPIYESEYQPEYIEKSQEKEKDNKHKQSKDREVRQLSLSESSGRGSHGRKIDSYGEEKEVDYKFEESQQSQDYFFNFIEKLAHIAGNKAKLEYRYAFQAIYLAYKFQPFNSISKQTNTPSNQPLKYSIAKDIYSDPNQPQSGINSISSIDIEGNHNMSLTYPYNISTSMQPQVQMQIPKRKHLFTIQDPKSVYSGTYPNYLPPNSNSINHGKQSWGTPMPTFNKIIEEEQEQSNTNTNSNIVAGGASSGLEFQFRNNLKMKKRKPSKDMNWDKYHENYDGNYPASSKQSVNTAKFDAHPSNFDFELQTDRYPSKQQHQQPQYENYGEKQSYTKQLYGNDMKNKWERNKQDRKREYEILEHKREQKTSTNGGYDMGNKRTYGSGEQQSVKINRVIKIGMLASKHIQIRIDEIINLNMSIKMNQSSRQPSKNGLMPIQMDQATDIINGNRQMQCYMFHNTNNNNPTRNNCNSNGNATNNNNANPNNTGEGHNDNDDSYGYCVNSSADEAADDEQETQAKYQQQIPLIQSSQKKWAKVSPQQVNKTGLQNPRGDQVRGNSGGWIKKERGEREGKEREEHMRREEQLRVENPYSYDIKSQECTKKMQDMNTSSNNNSMNPNANANVNVNVNANVNVNMNDGRSSNKNNSNSNSNSNNSNKSNTNSNNSPHGTYNNININNNSNDNGNKKKMSSNLNAPPSLQNNRKLEEQPVYIDVGQPIFLEKLQLQNSIPISRPLTSFTPISNMSQYQHPSATNSSVTSSIDNRAVILSQRPVTHNPYSQPQYTVKQQNVSPIRIQQLSPSRQQFLHLMQPQVMNPMMSPVMNKNRSPQTKIRFITNPSQQVRVKSPLIKIPAPAAGMSQNIPLSSSPPPLPRSGSPIPISIVQNNISQNNLPAIKVLMEKRDVSPNQNRKVVITYNNNERRPVSQHIVRPASMQPRYSTKPDPIINSIPIQAHNILQVRADYFGNSPTNKNEYRSPPKITFARAYSSKGQLNIQQQPNINQNVFNSHVVQFKPRPVSSMAAFQTGSNKNMNNLKMVVRGEGHQGNQKLSKMDTTIINQLEKTPLQDETMKKQNYLQQTPISESRYTPREQKANPSVEYQLQATQQPIQTIKLQPHQPSKKQQVQKPQVQIAYQPRSGINAQNIQSLTRVASSPQIHQTPYYSPYLEKEQGLKIIKQQSLVEGVSVSNLGSQGSQQGSMLNSGREYVHPMYQEYRDRDYRPASRGKKIMVFSKQPLS